MSKKIILTKRVKTVFLLVLMCLISISLTGCDSRESNGSLNLSDTYASVGTTNTVSVGEVYDELRYYAAGYINDFAVNVMYEQELKTVRENRANYKEKYEEAILNGIYGSHEEETLDELKEADAKKTVLAYIDTMHQQGYALPTLTTGTEYSDYKAVLAAYYDAVCSYYDIEVAKYVAAYNHLLEEADVTVDAEGKLVFGEITDESYFTVDDVIEWYEDNYVNTGDVNALVIRFQNNDEANKVLKLFGIKTYNGKWYQIKPTTEELETIKKSKVDYDKWYDEYVINEAKGLQSIDEIAGFSTILQIYQEIYKYVYTYRVTSTSLTGNHLKYYNHISSLIENKRGITAEEDKAAYDALVATLTADSAYAVEMNSEKVNTYSATFATYVYESLQVEENVSYSQFSISPQSKGSYSFLVFKFAHVADTEIYEEVENEDEEKENKLLATDEAKALINTILEELFLDTLSDSYIEDVEHDRVEDTKITIYDAMIESYFMYTSGSHFAENYEKNKKSNNNYIAEVKYKDTKKQIKTDDFYSYLEPLYGTQIAYRLLFENYIKTTPYYTTLNTEAKYDEYVETIKTILYYFSNDYYASSGYPSTMGKYTFMLMYFGTADVEEAVYDVLMLSDATAAFYNDYNEHGFTGDEFYEKLATYANESYNDYYSLTASGIQVFADLDQDGENDVLSAELQSLAKLLLEDVYTAISKSNSDYATAANNVVTEYYATTRDESVKDNNPTASEAKWAKYRKAGLELKVESIGEVTNTTTTVEANIQSKLESLYTTLVNENYGFVSSYLDDTKLVSEDNTTVTMLLITSGTLKSQIKYDEEDYNEFYDEVTIMINDVKETVTVTYETNVITKEQVKVYVAEYMLYGDVYSLPTSTTAALDTYLATLVSKYTSSASKTQIIKNTLGAVTLANENKTVAKNTNGLNPTYNDLFVTEYNSSTRTGMFEKQLQQLKDSSNGYDFETHKTWWDSMYKHSN